MSCIKACRVASPSIQELLRQHAIASLIFFSMNTANKVCPSLAGDGIRGAVDT